MGVTGWYVAATGHISEDVAEVLARGIDVNGYLAHDADKLAEAGVCTPWTAKVAFRALERAGLIEEVAAPAVRTDRTLYRVAAP